MLTLLNTINLKNNFINGNFFNNKYYLLNDKKEIYIYKEKFELEHIIKTEYQFISITYNSITNKYIASTENNFNRLYILNCDFKIISVFDLKIPKNMQNKIIDISYNETNNYYLLTTNNYILKIDINGNFQKTITKKYKIISSFNNYVIINDNNSLFFCKLSQNGNIIKNDYILDNINLKILNISENYIELINNNYIYRYILINNKNILKIIFDNEKKIYDFVNNYLNTIKFNDSMKNINYLIELEKISNKNLKILLDISKNIK